MAWFFLQAPPSGRAAKHMLEGGWLSSRLRRGVALVFFCCCFLFRTLLFPLALPPPPRKEPVCLAAPGAASQPHPAARTPRSLPSWEVPHRPPVPLIVPPVSSRPWSRVERLVAVSRWLLDLALLSCLWVVECLHCPCIPAGLRVCPCVVLRPPVLTAPVVLGHHPEGLGVSEVMSLPVFGPIMSLL